MGFKYPVELGRGPFLLLSTAKLFTIKLKIRKNTTLLRGVLFLCYCLKVPLILRAVRFRRQHNSIGKKKKYPKSNAGQSAGHFVQQGYCVRSFAALHKARDLSATRHPIPHEPSLLIFIKAQIPSTVLGLISGPYKTLCLYAEHIEIIPHNYLKKPMPRNVPEFLFQGNPQSQIWRGAV